MFGKSTSTKPLTHCSTQCTTRTNEQNNVQRFYTAWNKRGVQWKTLIFLEVGGSGDHNIVQIVHFISDSMGFCHIIRVQNDSDMIVRSESKVLL